MMKQIPVSVARKIAKDNVLDAVIILGFSESDGVFGGTSYGKDRDTCGRYSEVLDEIIEFVNEGLIRIPLPKPTEK